MAEGASVSSEDDGYSEERCGSYSLSADISESESSSGFSYSRRNDPDVGVSSSYLPSLSSPLRRRPVVGNCSTPVPPSLFLPVIGGRDVVWNDNKTRKSDTDLSDIELMKERFAKLLLGEDMSGGGKGVCTALAISNAITNLAATVFGELWRLEPLAPMKKKMWCREMEWLLCVSDSIVELVPSIQDVPGGGTFEIMATRPRSDLYVNRNRPQAAVCGYQQDNNQHWGRFRTNSHSLLITLKLHQLVILSFFSPPFSMGIAILQPQSHLYFPSNFMNPFSFSSKFIKRRTASTSFFTSLNIRAFCVSSLDLNNTQNGLIQLPADKRDGLRNTRVTRAGVKFTDAELKENWLSSLSCPFPGEAGGLRGSEELPRSNVGSKLVIGVDPDVSGALAVLKTDDLGCTAQVFDSPSLQVLVGKRVRRRLDAKSIVQLLRSFDAPMGTSAYIEQSIPYPQDGKQGWWSGGFGYGLWIGVLVASGFCVTPVPSVLWKNEFELSGSRSSKDDSRKLASELFPSLSPMLKRKKDHGRAEALLIAAYGNGHRIKRAESCIHLEPIS